MSRLRLTLVTPSFNQGQFLDQCLQSVADQHYENLEHIVVDGGSTDASVDVIRRHASHLTRWRSHKDDGQSAAIAEGFSQATGDVFGWLNSDDFFYPGALDAIAEIFEKRPATSFVCADSNFVSADGDTIEHVKRTAAYTFDELLDYGGDKYLAQPSVFFRGSLFRAAGGIDASLVYGMDLDLWLRMRKLAPLTHLPRTISAMRHHDDAKTWRANERAMLEIEGIVRRHARASRSPTAVAKGWLSMRRRRALAACGAGMQAHREGDSAGASAAWRRALSLYPPIASTTQGAQLAARIVLPLPLRRRLLKVP